MKLINQEVRDGVFTGDTVWICHYLRPDVDKKALRNVPPTKVLIRSNSELPKNKKVYYSTVHFSPFGKSGNVQAKVISPVDNTGYRTNIGNELFIFTEESECVDEWNKQVSECCGRLEEQELTAADYWKRERSILARTKK